MRYKLIEFLQKRNPNVPAIIYKLEAEKHRDLTVITRIWKELSESLVLEDIYSGNLITENSFELNNNMSIDHFIPWSFIGHNMIWNLTPTTKNINSRKNDNLPEWNEYFLKFAEQQYDMFTFLIKNKKYKKHLEDYFEIFKDLDINEITNHNKQINKEEFIYNLKICIHPLYQIAYNQGFKTWILEKSLVHKEIQKVKLTL